MRNPISAAPQAAYESDLVAYERGRRSIVWITAPALIKQVLLDERENFLKLAQIRLFGPLLGKGILTSEGADWKWQRQASAPMFRPQDLAGFVPTFVRAAERLIERWRARPSAVQPVDHDMTEATFEVISATLLPSGDERMPLVIERSTALFQRSSTWGQLYAIANLPRWLPQPRHRAP